MICFYCDRCKKKVVDIPSDGKPFSEIIYKMRDYKDINAVKVNGQIYYLCKACYDKIENFLSLSINEEEQL